MSLCSKVIVRRDLSVIVPVVLFNGVNLKVWIRILLIVALVCLSGCAAKPQLRFDYDKYSSIGVVNTVEPEITHSYLGVTIFNNVEKKYQVNWDIPARMTNRLISTSNTNIKVLKPPLWYADNPRELTSQGWDSNEVNKKHFNTVKELCKTNNLDAIIFISSFKGPRGEGGFSADVSGYGILTQSSIGNNFAQGYMNVAAEVVNCNPLTYTVWANARQANRIFDYIEPENNEPLSQAEIAKAKSIIESRADHIIDTIISKLGIEKPLIYQTQ